MIATLKFAGVAGAVAFASVFWMAADRVPCSMAMTTSLPTSVNGVATGRTLVVRFVYARQCDMTILPDTAHWRLIYSTGGMYSFDPDSTKFIYAKGGASPTGLVAVVPADAPTGASKFRISLQVTKNILQEKLNWPLNFNPPDLPFNIVSPSEQKEPSNG